MVEFQEQRKDRYELWCVNSMHIWDLEMMTCYHMATQSSGAIGKIGAERSPNAKTPGLSVGGFAFRIRCLAVTYSHMANATLPSAQLRFTSEFGMESGGSTALLPPGEFI